MRYKKTRAQSIMEYLLVFGGIVIAIMAGVKIMGNKTKGMMNTSGEVLNQSAQKVSGILGS